MHFIKILVFVIIGLLFTSIEATAQYKSQLGINNDGYTISNKTLDIDRSNGEELKRRDVAIWWGVGMTSVPIIANALSDPATDNTAVNIISGPLWIIGPSAGLIYAKDYRSAVNGSLIRLGGIAVIGTGALTLLASEGDNVGLGATIIAAGAGIYIYSGIKDIFFNGPSSVDNYNEKLTGNSKISVVPWYNRKLNSAGLSVRLSL